ncbi:uncharacterized protein Triagg1_6229 [Trichoderma aggressivum f. europaeum]|uniref:Uncharacterized protein n=1 Tax=Trichoderma aggressivum f. europaeum TaxID=173218 RepID=A0AAE1LZM6_9HYPO|nr:hypothetical protein Triagg1_6229 [Trichoderma aggressivum f. europaeum]
MSLEHLAPSRRKAFVFAEFLGGGRVFKAHSCGNGRFIQGAPNQDLEICFILCKTPSSLDVTIYEDNLKQWLRAITSLRNRLIITYFGILTSMKRLAPRCPEMSAKFNQDRREGRSFDALELFVRHFLREGSVSAFSDFDPLHESGILTDTHRRDIFNQTRSMSASLDLLDEAVDEIDDWDIKALDNSLHFVNEPSQSQLLTVIRRREAQQRRAVAHRLLAKVTNSYQRLLGASTMQGVSAGAMAFANQIGTRESVCRSGTRAIRDICEGYMPRNLSDIVNALQVANAMQSVVPPSNLGYSKKEFIDDIPQWASLLSPDDQPLFFEIASHLWGIPIATISINQASDTRESTYQCPHAAQSRERVAQCVVTSDGFTTCHYHLILHSDHSYTWLDYHEGFDGRNNVLRHLQFKI